MFSRVRVTHLPKHITVPRLREHFATCGEITDCVVIRSKDEKKLPRMAFLGFKESSMAEAAIRQMQHSFIGVHPVPPLYFGSRVPFRILFGCWLWAVCNQRQAAGGGYRAGWSSEKWQLLLAWRLGFAVCCGPA